MERVAFKLGQTNSQAGLEIDTGSGSGYYRVAVYESGGKLYQALATSTGSGTSYFNPTVLIDSFQANKWYVLEMAADDAAGFRVSVWDEAVAGVRYEARWEMPTGQPWTFRGWVYTSGTTLWLDTYREEPPSVKTADVRYAGQHYEDDRGPTPSVTKRYYAEGKLLATRTGATLTYVQSDHLGSTSTLTDASGSVIARERYSAFGERRRSDNLAITDQLYTSQQYNSLSGLYHYSDGKSAGRFYDPLLARFVIADSVTPGNASQGLNRYAYANNSPVRYNDPDGHCPMCFTAAAGAAIGAGIAYVPQVVANISRDGASGNAFTNVNWSAVGAGAVAGAVGGATFGIGTAVVGTGFVATVGTGAVSGVLAGQVGRTTENVLTGRDATEGLGNIGQIARDAVVGGALGGAGYGLGRLGQATDTIVARGMLPEDVIGTFRRGEYGSRVTEVDELWYRAEGQTFGRWFGRTRPESAALAEQLYNVAQYGNDLTQVSTYRVPANTTIYEGWVEGGSGWQMYVPNARAAGIELLRTEPLPQLGF